MSDHPPPNPWNRRLWGVLFHSGSVDAPRLLGGPMWDDALRDRAYYPGEPTRPLLFKTRAQARAWCRPRMQEWRARKDIVARWTVRPVAVREIIHVEPIRLTIPADQAPRTPCAPTP